MSVTSTECTLVLLLQLIKFSGCYHGHADSFLVQAGSGVLTLGLPDSPGVPKSSTGELASRSKDDTGHMDHCHVKTPRQRRVAAAVRHTACCTSGGLRGRRDRISARAARSKLAVVQLCTG